MRLTTLFITIILSTVSVSMAQEDDPLGLSSSAVLKRINSQYGQYFADKIVEMRGTRGQSQPREWTIIVNDERSQRRLRTVVVAGDRIRDAGETLDYYPDNLPIGFASSAKIKIDSVKAFNILIKEARAARIGFDYIDYKLRSLEFGDEPVWVLSAMNAKGILLGQVILSAFDANVFRTVWYYRGSKGYVKIVDSALDGLKKTEPIDDNLIEVEPKPLEESGRREPVTEQPERREPVTTSPLNPRDPGTEEAEIRPVKPN